MNTSRTASLCAVLLAPWAAAQEPTVGGPTSPAHGPDLRTPVHTQPAEPGEPAYGLWAAGAGYKASFHDGMTFVPFLGRSYPQNQPFAWRTTSVRIGDQELLAGSAPATSHTDWRVEYDHGPVVEAYDVRSEGLEQTFVFAKRPRGDGDLRIRGAVTTGLWTTAVEEAAGELVFRDAAGVPIVTYGRAVAVDADGDVFQMTTTCVAGQITLRLAAAELARADFPLVVDPLLAPATVYSLGTIDHAGEVDLATESTVSPYNTVCSFIDWASATDADLRVRICPIGNLSSNSSYYSDLGTTTSVDHPRAAYVGGAVRWVIVYQHLTVATQQMRVRAAIGVGNSTNFAVAAPFLPGSGGGVHHWRPVVGGTDPVNPANTAMVLLQRESGSTAFANTSTSEIVAVPFSPLAANPWGTPLVIHDTATEDAERPAINRIADGGASFAWFAVWQVFNNSIAGDDWDLLGRLVTNTGTQSAATWISSNTSLHKLGPVVDGRHGRFCVAFSTADPVVGKVQDAVGTQFCCERLDWASAAAAPTVAGNLPVETLATNTFRILEPSAITYDGNTRSHWALAWRSSSTSPALYATRVGYRGKPLQSPDLVHYNSAAIPGLAGIAHNEHLTVTVVAYAVDGLAASVQSRRFQLPTSPSTTSGGTACTSATLIWQGPAGVNAPADRWIGSEFAGPSVIQAPANALHLLLVGDTPMNVPLALSIVGAGCSLLVPASGAGHLGTMPLAIGSSVNWQLPLPEHLPAMTIYLQDWVLDPADNLLRGTSRIQVDLAK